TAGERPAELAAVRVARYRPFRHPRVSSTMLAVAAFLTRRCSTAIATVHRGPVVAFALQCPRFRCPRARRATFTRTLAATVSRQLMRTRPSERCLTCGLFANRGRLSPSDTSRDATAV